MDVDSFVAQNDSNHSGGGGCLEDVLFTIENAPLLKGSQTIKQRFWDMFVVDAFIKNNDRNNGNWEFFNFQTEVISWHPFMTTAIVCSTKETIQLHKKDLTTQTF